MKKHIFSLMVLFSSFNCAIAQEDKIETDRPDETESPNIVAKKWLQFEGGFTSQKNDESNREYLLPTLLTKYGLSKRIELRLITEVKTESSLIIPNGTVYKTTLQQVQLGAKVALFEEKKFLPKTSLLFHAGIPGLASYETDKFLFNTRLAMQHSLTKNISLGYNLGVEFDGTSDDPVFIYTLSTGFNLSEKLYTFIEVYGTLFEDAEHNIDAGFAYAVSKNFKVDISSGFGLSPNAPKYFISLGASVRFKTAK